MTVASLRERGGKKTAHGMKKQLESLLAVSHDILPAVLELLINKACTCPGGTIMARPPLRAQPDKRAATGGLGGLAPHPPPLCADMKEDSSTCY